MIKFSLLCPTRERPDHLSDFIASIAETIDNPRRVEILFAVDFDDKRTRYFFENLTAPEGLAIKPFFRKRAKFLSRDYYNWLASKASGHYLWAVGDDVRFLIKGWDSRILEEIEHYAEDKPDRIFLVSVNDKTPKPSFMKDHKFFPCFPIITKEAFDFFGFFIHPEMPNWGADICLFHLYNSCGRILPIYDAEYLDHVSWHTKQCEQDNVNKRVAILFREHNKRHPSARPEAIRDNLVPKQIEKLRRKIKMSVNHKFVIVAYYTRNTPYEDEAKNLEKSILENMPEGCLYDITGIESVGNWHQNNLYKATILKDMLIKHRMPILYVDSDALMLRYPDIFNAPDFDFACHYFRGRILAGGTLFFNTTPEAMRLIEAWIKRNDEKPKNTDQFNLQQLIESPDFKESLKVKKLPVEYCHIFDEPYNNLEPPFVRHTQASRKHREKIKESPDLKTEHLFINEKEKYSHIWATNYKPSQCAKPLAQYVDATIKDRNQSCLDLGCGDGTTVMALRRAGIYCHGLDITMAGVEKHGHPGFRESTLWQMPLKDNAYDFVFSTDVLEHLPSERVDDAIREIFRITRLRAFHVIATFPDPDWVPVKLHLTVRPIEWWREKFEKLNTKGLDCLILDRQEFLMFEPAKR